MRAFEDDVRPDVDNQGVPWCRDTCPHHDGKRCRVLGLRPDAICEPAVIQIQKALDDLQIQVKESQEWP